MTPLKVGFVLASSPQRPLPSTRIAVTNMWPLMPGRGVESLLLYAPDQPSETPELPHNLLDTARQHGLDLVMFQKTRGPHVVQLIMGLRASGIRSGFMVCDIIDDDMVAATDGTITVTEQLRSLHAAHLHNRIHVVHDGIERPDEVALPSDRSDRVRAVLVTSAQLHALPIIRVPPPWLHVTVVGSYAPTRIGRMHQFRWAMSEMEPSLRGDAWRFMVSHRTRCVPWSEAVSYATLRHADIAIIPVDGPIWSPADPGLPPSWLRKSENRLTLKMAMGLPVVATPIPSYEAAVEDGTNAFFARNRAEWLMQLSRLRDPELRRRAGAAARASVIDRFSMTKQADLLASAMRHIANNPKVQQPSGAHRADVLGSPYQA
jgi:Glycosyl transferases group 1